MQENNRDIVVLSPKISNSIYKELEVDFLHKILNSAESIFNICIANEVFDISKNKAIRKPIYVQKALRDRLGKPFVFICCKN
jgi:hypothetical protein